MHDADELQTDHVGDHRDQSMLRRENNRRTIRAQSMLLQGLPEFEITLVFLLFRAVIFLIPNLINFLLVLPC